MDHQGRGLHHAAACQQDWLAQEICLAPPELGNAFTGPHRGNLPRRYYAIESEGIQALNDARAVTDRLWEGVRWPLRVSS